MNINNLKHISKQLGINLFIIDETYYPQYLGGSKARKIIPILEKAKKENSNALVSSGSANSNHARVVALAAAEFGWKCHLVIHDKEDYSKANLQLMKLAGAKLTFCSLPEVAVKMENAMESFKDDGLNPFYIWGGGCSVEGSMVYYNVVHQYKEKLTKVNWDYVFVASGTGGTQAGLHIGFKELFPNTKVMGISIARDKERGQQAVYEEAIKITEQQTLPKVNKKEILFYDEWVGDGYGKVYPRLLEVILNAGKEEGLITDPTYTGKVLTAIYDMVENNKISQNSNILFWHTGGIFNLFEHWEDI